MNSDPHDSAAWRTFGMLDADEAAGFDEAMRDDPELMKALRDMECLSAAVAAASTVPVVPKAGQLERLHLRLGLNAPRKTNWGAISGWAAAAAVTLLLAFNQAKVYRTQTALIEQAARPTVLPVSHPRAKATVDEEAPEETTAVELELPQPPPSMAITQVDDIKMLAAADETRLNHEIGVLKNQLKNYEKLERERFEAVPGMAWPVVMRMSPPGSSSGTTGSLMRPGEDPPVTAALVDALTGTGKGGTDKGEPVGPGGDPFVATGLGTDEGVSRDGLLPPPEVKPFAVPIYDLARDTGTLMVSNLPPVGAGESYNLWVRTSADGPPIHVGKLPQMDYRVADSFDFNLGKTGIVPTGFILTRDVQSVPPQPSEVNTVLEGPK